MRRSALNLLIILAFLLSISTTVKAQEGGLRLTPGKIQISSIISGTNSQDDRSPTFQKKKQDSAQDLHPVSVIVTLDSSVDPASLAAVTGGRLIHRYRNVFNGASLVLAPGKVEALKHIPGVTGIYPDVAYQVDTEESPAFISAPAVWSQLGGQNSAGEGVIVGVIDTGIWPEHPSFSDPDPSGKTYAPPPGGPYACNFGNTAWNPNDAPFTCNNKLIGAYEFLDTYKSQIGLDPNEFDSARDSDGHGSHTSSTAAGNAGVSASILGTNFGDISGIAPRAHVIMYRVCAGMQGSCYTSDSVAAIDQAILDGVDVLNFSIGGGTNPYSDPVSLAFLRAFQNGIFVAASAGNSGPGLDTVAHREPWVTTVAASTQSRTFKGEIHLLANNNDTLDLEGVSIGGSVSGEILSGADYGNALCGSSTGVNPFPPGTFTSNQIVICQRGITARVEKSANVQAAGGGGVILYNPSLNSLNADNHFLPTVHINHTDGASLLNFLSTHSGLTGSIQGGVKVFEQGDILAAFSSRGGPGQILGISKPDISAPGVNILAAHTLDPAFPISGGAGLPGESFRALGGTSMSSPHIAGSGALLKALHPSWTPGQIKSALMMTSISSGIVKEDAVSPADPFDFGSGRVDLTNAGNPGLTISASYQDFIDHENDLWNVNYPSFFLPDMPGLVTIQRTVHSELGSSAQWDLSVNTPPDMIITVPGSITVGPGAESTFDITLDANLVPLGGVRHAMLNFSNNLLTIHFPITIVRGQPVIKLEKNCSPATILLNHSTNCSILVENISFAPASIDVTDVLPGELSLNSASVVGATTVLGNTLTYQGVLAGRSLQAINVVNAAGQTPAGYLPLSLFGIAPIPNVGDETIININVDPYIFAGRTYSTIQMVSNGFAVVGGGFGAVSYINQFLPNPSPPNNVLAPFWTDLDPGAGGALRAAYITNNLSTWLVLDWQNVRVYQESEVDSFQIWIGMDGEEDISFTFGNVGNGYNGNMTVGAENENGTIGQSRYNNGKGLPVSNGMELMVVSLLNPGGTHQVTYRATGVLAGDWTNCAMMSSGQFQGVNTGCFSGRVNPFGMYLPILFR